MCCPLTCIGNYVISIFWLYLHAIALLAYPKFSCISMSKGIRPAVADSLDKVWNIRNEVERSLITTVHIYGLVRDITLFSSVLSMHSKKLSVWCSSISSTCYYLLQIEGGGGGGGVTIKLMIERRHY